MLRSALDLKVGNARELDRALVQKSMGTLLIEGETISHAFQISVRDQAVFTNFRIVLLDKQGVSGNREAITFFPYKDVLNWSVSTAGLVDLDCEMCIALKGKELPLALNFSRAVDIEGVCKMLGSNVLL